MEPFDRDRAPDDRELDNRDRERAAAPIPFGEDDGLPEPMPYSPGEDFFDAEELAGLRGGLNLPSQVLPLEDEPSTLVARYMFPTEKFRGEWHRHWINPAKGLFVIALYAFLLCVLTVQRVKPQYVGRIMAIVIACAVLVALVRVTNWYFTRIVLTGKRIMLVQGVVVRRVATIPLARVTDLRYVQSPVGRLLNYGTFRVEDAGWRNPMRKIIELPNPNELYLRVIEEVYEPAAVEARLGYVVSDALREAFHGPTLVNYDGWVSVEIRGPDGPVAPSADRRVALGPNAPYELVVSIGTGPVAPIAEPLVVTGGVSSDVAVFEVELDSDQPSLRRRAVEIEATAFEGNHATFIIHGEPGNIDRPPWLWVRVSQRHRTLQNIELLVERTPGRGRG
jgi:membrane protein YdbS with pleckstrin-like domain